MLRVTVLAVLVLLAAAPAAADHNAADPLPWSEFVPPFSTVANAQPGPVPGCRRIRVRCVDRVERRLVALRERLGCDHRAIFPVTYAHVTERIAEALRQGLYRHRRWLIVQDVVFADYYFRAFDAYEAGHPVPPAWQVAFDAWTKGDTSAGQDMLLGINAHVQRDMPFVLAEVGLHTPRGVSRKAEHEKGNIALSRSYDQIVDDVSRNFDPIVGTVDVSPNPLDDVGFLQVVRGWREGVWRNAERLLNARTPAEYAQVADSIETHAEHWARSFLTVEPTGYNAYRDAYCEANSNS